MHTEHSFRRGLLVSSVPKGPEEYHIFCRTVSSMICGIRMMPINFWHKHEEHLDHMIGNLMPVIRQALNALESEVLWPFFERNLLFPHITFVHDHRLVNLGWFDSNNSTFTQASAPHFMFLCQDGLNRDERERAIMMNTELIILNDGLDHIPQQIYTTIHDWWITNPSHVTGSSMEVSRKGHYLPSHSTYVQVCAGWRS